MGTRRTYRKEGWGKKLVEAQVLEIRRQISEGVYPLLIARDFDISLTMLSKIRDRRMWRDTP